MGSKNRHLIIVPPSPYVDFRKLRQMLQSLGIESLDIVPTNDLEHIRGQEYVSCEITGECPPITDGERSRILSQVRP